MKRFLFLVALALTSCKPRQPAVQIEMRLVPAEACDLRAAAEIIRARLPVRGPTVEVRPGAILVGLTAATDEAAVTSLVTRKGELSFAPVSERSGVWRALGREPVSGVTATDDGAIDGPSDEALLSAIKTAAPLAESERGVFERVDGKPRLWIVDDARTLRPEITRASARPDPYGRWQVEIVMSPEGGRRFEELTRAVVGHKLAIVVDGAVQSVPVVMEPIGGGTAVVSALTEKEAEALAKVLPLDPLPCTLTVERISAVGR